MEFQDFSRSKALNHVPQRKLDEKLSEIKDSNLEDKIKILKLTAFNRYFESNIPTEYWDLKMEKDFHGDPRLLKLYLEYVSSIKDNYISGKSICLAGNHGLGKTFAVTSVLKKVVQKGYSGLYTTLSDIVNVLLQSSNEEKFTARRELNMVDFLAIDEFDSRFIQSDNAADLYARTLEGIFRTRSQNKIPTLMCTNSPNIIETFNGPLKNSVDSLFNGYLKIFPVFGEDYRKKEA